VHERYSRLRSPCPDRHHSPFLVLHAHPIEELVVDRCVEDGDGENFACKGECVEGSAEVVDVAAAVVDRGKKVGKRLTAIVRR